MADSFCTKCGTPGSGAFCADCGQPRDAALIPAAQPVVVSVPSTQQRHGLPGLLSFFFPSLGQFVKGDLAGGLVVIGLFFGLALFTAAGAVPAAFGFPIVWIWQIYDAYTAPDGATKRELKRLGRR